MSLNLALHFRFVHWERKNKVRTSIEAFVRLTMMEGTCRYPALGEEDHYTCIKWTGLLHAHRCVIHVRAINKDTKSMRVNVQRSIDHNNTYACIKTLIYRWEQRYPNLDVHYLLTHISEKLLIIKIFLLLLGFFATVEELVVDVDWSWSGATDKIPSGTPLGPPTSDTPGYGRYRWEITHRANKTS